MKFYVSEHEKDGGIHLFSVSGKAVKEEQFVPLDRVTYFTVKDGKLYAVLRDPFGTMESGMVAFDIKSDGTLYNQSEIFHTNGKSGCHISVENGRIYVANYRSANVCKMPDTVVTHKGSGPNPDRQEEAHPHFAAATPDGKFICVTDLGTDEIFLYDKNLNEKSRVILPAGSGPRHIAFSKDGKYSYCACELSSMVALLSYDGEKLKFLMSAKTVPDGYGGENFPAAIRVMDDRLYVSNRGHDSIACFDISNNTPVLTDCVPSLGANPRDIFLRGDRLLCANRESGDVTVFTLKNGIPKYDGIKIKVKSPTCVFITQE